MIKLENDTVPITSSGSSSKSGYVSFIGNAIELIDTGSVKNKDFTAMYPVNVVGSQERWSTISTALPRSYSTASNTTNSGK